MNVHSIGVVGCGQMGRSIAQAAAAAGYTVLIAAADPARLEAGMASLTAQVDADVAQGRLTTQQRDALLGRLRGADTLDALAGCDLVIESIVEDIDAKKRLFAALDRAVQPAAILTSNT